MDFEDGMSSLRDCLPAGIRLASCFTCVHPDFSPYGAGAFGTLFCSRERKPEFRDVRLRKQELLAL
ncbi:MAG: hypothetical protein ACI841_001267 [Planctomycetota bacterium]|jgi:hypothetical protein